MRAWTRLDEAGYRWLGWSPAATLMGVEVLRLTTIGRRSGRRRSVLVACLADDAGAGFLVGGGNWGWDHDPGWLHNLRARPACEVQRGRRPPRAMVASVLEGGAADAAREALTAAYPHSQAYVERRVRPVPVVRLSPADPA
jgi:deazaflavin-dependent oxidoreductase (nitroreductase family)